MEDPGMERLRERLKRDSLDQLTHYLIGREYMKSGRFMAAAASYRRSIEINPDYAEAWRAMGEAYENAGVDKEAESAYGHAALVAERTGDQRVLAAAREALPHRGGGQI